MQTKNKRTHADEKKRACRRKTQRLIQTTKQRACIRKTTIIQKTKTHADKTTLLHTQKRIYIRKKNDHADENKKH